MTIIEASYSQFFQDCGFEPLPEAYKIDTPIECKMEKLRCKQRMRGLCACIISNHRTTTEHLKVCHSLPHVGLKGTKDPFGYCKTHLRYRKRHTLKYLGFNAITRWKRHRDFKTAMEETEAIRSLSTLRK